MSPMLEELAARLGPVLNCRFVRPRHSGRSTRSSTSSERVAPIEPHRRFHRLICQHPRRHPPGRSTTPPPRKSGSAFLFPLSCRPRVARPVPKTATGTHRNASDYPPRPRVPDPKSAQFDRFRLNLPSQHAPKMFPRHPWMRATVVACCDCDPKTGHLALRRLVLLEIQIHPIGLSKPNQPDQRDRHHDRTGHRRRLPGHP